MRAAFIMLAAGLLLAACGGGTTAGSSAGYHLDGGSVTGYVVADGDTMRSCPALAESYPPRCGGDATILAGIEPADIVGMQRPTGGVGGDVAWSAAPIRLLGEVDGDAFRVTKVDQAVVTAEGDGWRVRLSWSPGLVSGEDVTWLLDVTNETSTARTLHFRSGQDADVVLLRNGEEIYRWSTGMFFTQALRDVTAAPGVPFGVSLPSRLTVAPGSATLRGMIVADETASLVAESDVEIQG